MEEKTIRVLRSVTTANKNGSIRVTLPTQVVKRLDLQNEDILVFTSIEDKKFILEKWQPNEAQ